MSLGGTMCELMAKFSPFLSSDISLSCSLLLKIFAIHFFFNSFTFIGPGSLFSYCACLPFNLSYGTHSHTTLFYCLVQFLVLRDLNGRLGVLSECLPIFTKQKGWKFLWAFTDGDAKIFPAGLSCNLLGFGVVCRWSLQKGWR